jgi:hypothetical protein
MGLPLKMQLCITRAEVISEKLDQKSRTHFSVKMTNILQSYLFGYEDYKHGAVPDHLWETQRKSMIFQLSHPGVRGWWYSIGVQLFLENAEVVGITLSELKKYDASDF